MKPFAFRLLLFWLWEDCLPLLSGKPSYLVVLSEPEPRDSFPLLALYLSIAYATQIASAHFPSSNYIRRFLQMKMTVTLSH